MRTIRLSAALLLLFAPALRADEVPFASPPLSGDAEPDLRNVVNLGDIMGQTQMRHIKLWYAGDSGNWRLVDYEIDRISESLTRAATLYTNIPIEFVAAAFKPIAEMRSAAATKDQRAFVRGYANLTKACNVCHEAGGVGFIRIQTPTSMPFTDELFVK